MVDALVGFADTNESIADDSFFTFFSHNMAESKEIFAFSVYVNTRGITNNTTPFDKVKALPAFYNITTVQSIADAASTSQVQSGTRFVTSIAKAAESVRGNMDYIYLNHADVDQDPLGTYGGSKLS
ncbi:hypothetical protein F4802DRAFT_601371 [Xylaria palmicola]|nr:hypothetical protein F4802DRAFT_601371 [Xylaria palmicola]